MDNLAKVISLEIEKELTTDKQDYLMFNVNKALKNLAEVGVEFDYSDLNFMWSNKDEEEKDDKGIIAGTYSKQLKEIVINNMYLDNKSDEIVDTIIHELMHHLCADIYEDFFGIECASLDTHPCFLGILAWLNMQGVKVTASNDLKCITRSYTRI